MSNILTKGAKNLKLATQMTHPEIVIMLNPISSQRPFYQVGDEVSGTLSLELPFEIDHQGVRIYLKGVVRNKSSDVYYGGAIGGMLVGGAKYEFVKLSRELEAPGNLQQGLYDFKFNFKNVDMDTDSYNGIALDVAWSVVAELVYQGNLMNYTVSDEQVFTVRNSRQPSKDLGQAKKQRLADDIAKPVTSIEFVGMRDLQKPLKFEVQLVSTHLNIDRDQILGSFALKDISEDVSARLNSVSIQLVQQEVQGASKQSLQMPDSMVGDRLATIPGQTAVSQSGQPYKLRVLKEHQIMDGCCEKGDSIDFRIPLRGAHSKFLTPTVKNVFNKFSVRFFLRVVVKITPAAKARE